MADVMFRHILDWLFPYGGDSSRYEGLQMSTSRPGPFMESLKAFVGMALGIGIIIATLAVLLVVL